MDLRQVVVQVDLAGEDVVAEVALHHGVLVYEEVEFRIGKAVRKVVGKRDEFLKNG